MNPEFAKHIDWSTPLTTIAENLLAVSYFKHETFSVLQYAMDFGTTDGQQSGKPVILEILRRTTLFFRLETSLPAIGMPKEAEITM